MGEDGDADSFFSWFFGGNDLAEIKIRGILLEERKHQHSTAATGKATQTAARGRLTWNRADFGRDRHRPRRRTDNTA